MRVAVRCDGRELTYAQLDERSRRLSGGALRDLRVRAGDRVAVLAPNCIEYPELICGFSDAGAVVATLNPRSNAAEIVAACADCGARVLVVHPTVEVVAREALADLDARLLVLGRDYESWLTMQAPATEAELPDIDEGSPFTLVYSSGTTGEPKGVLLSHRSRVLTFHAMAMEYGCYGPDDRFLAIAPMAHGAGFAFGMASLYFGGSVDIVTKFDAQNVLERVAEGVFTGVFMVPTHFQAIFALPPATLERFRGRVRGLRAIISNAAALPQPMKEQVVEYFGPGLLHETYGSTEASIVTNIRPADQLRTAQSGGRPFGLNEVRLLDEQGAPVVPGEVGELFSRSPYLFNGYWNRPQETADCLRDGGWVSAGDLARIDDEGFLYIVDRKKDMVISGGLNIYPREIERVLEQHTAVQEACVVGIADARWGERLRAFVVVAAGQADDEVLAHELLRHCRTHLAAYKAPRELVFITSVPRNAGGKVLKRDLREALDSRFTVHIHGPQVHVNA